MAKCPHCSESIDSLSGFIKQEDLESRLNTQKDAHSTALGAKETEITMLKGSVSDLTSKASNYDAVASERDTLKGEIVTIRDTHARQGALAQIGVTDPKVIQGFEAIHASITAGMPEADRPGFIEFDKWGAKDHPLLAANFVDAGTGDGGAQAAADAAAAAAAGGGAGAAGGGDAAAAAAAAAGAGGAGAATGPNGLPDASGGAADPNTQAQGKLTPAQVHAVFQSPEFKALDKDGRAAKIAELKGNSYSEARTG